MKYVAVDELEHFCFHDAKVESLEWIDGDMLWRLSALNATTENSQNDSPKDLCIRYAEMVLEHARIEKVVEPGYNETDAEHVTRFIEEKVTLPHEYDAVLQDILLNYSYILNGELIPIIGKERQNVDLLITCNGPLYEMAVSFTKSIVQWDDYSGLAYYEKWRMEKEKEIGNSSPSQ